MCSRRCVPQLRCLVVLPTRDLAAQVFKVFSGLCPAVGLRVGLAAAQASVATEAADLFGSTQNSGMPLPSQTTLTTECGSVV